MLFLRSCPAPGPRLYTNLLTLSTIGIRSQTKSPGSRRQRWRNHQPLSSTLATVMWMMPVQMVHWTVRRRAWADSVLICSTALRKRARIMPPFLEAFLTAPALHRLVLSLVAAADRPSGALQTCHKRESLSLSAVRFQNVFSLCSRAVTAPFGTAS